MNYALSVSQFITTPSVVPTVTKGIIPLKLFWVQKKILRDTKIYFLTAKFWQWRFSPLYQVKSNDKKATMLAVVDFQGLILRGMLKTLLVRSLGWKGRE
jgi:hypothetical protein